ncbi:MAG: hypothetical protein HY553_12125 [Elusimicrobia bacterium]|nr:hypothetical protein [Elusimicrobiota bacterium]
MVLSIVLSAAFASPPAARTLGAAEEAAKAGVARTQEAQARNRRTDDEAVVRSALTAMGDGNTMGEHVTSFLAARGIQVAIAKQPEGAKVAGARLTVSDRLPRYPRVLGPYIAEAATRLRLAAQPDTAEREYMVRSTVARVWLELGGDHAGLPEIEPLIGYRDSTLSGLMTPWIDRAQPRDIGRATGKKSLQELCSSPAQNAACEAAEKDYVAFMLAEREWRQVNAHLVHP